MPKALPMGFASGRWSLPWWGGNQGTATVVANMGYPFITMGTATTATTIVATFGNSAAQALVGRNVTWSRAGDTGTWSCTTTVDAKYAPNGCPVVAAAT